MKQVTIEFSRPIEAARVPAGGSHEKISADQKECAALAKRLKVPALHALSAHLQVKPWRGGGLKVTGSATADLEQVSVISLETFRSSQTFEVERYFMPRIPEDASSEEDIDPMPGGVIDIGEIVAEAVALDLDPYPRKPDEVFETRIEDISSPEGENVSPFRQLKEPETGKK